MNVPEEIENVGVLWYNSEKIGWRKCEMQDVLLGKLPDPFVFADGGRVKTKEDWERRRLELLRDAAGSGKRLTGKAPYAAAGTKKQLPDPYRGREKNVFLSASCRYAERGRPVSGADYRGCVL